MEPFELRVNPARIVFGAGAIGTDRRDDPPAWLFPRARPVDPASEGRGREAGRHPRRSRRRSLRRRHDAHARRGDRGCAGGPSRSGADCTVAYGGGSTTGLGKALAYRTDLPQIAIPTTYAGSGGRRRSWDRPRAGRKTTVSDAEDPAGSRDLRSRADLRPARRHDRDERSQRHGPCRRGALCPRPQPDLLADGGGGRCAR